MKIAKALIVFSALAVFPVAAQAGGWATDTGSGCKVWNEDPRSGETMTWTGACYNGLAMGQGKVQWFLRGAPAGSYVGGMLEGRKHGKGRVIRADGSSEDGTFVLGERTPHMFW